MRAHHVFNHVYSGKHVVINARTSCVSRVYSGKHVFINVRTSSVDRVYSGNNWCNRGRGMCYPVCGMVHIKNPCC